MATVISRQAPVVAAGVQEMDIDMDIDYGSAGELEDLEIVGKDCFHGK